MDGGPTDSCPIMGKAQVGFRYGDCRNRSLFPSRYTTQIDQVVFFVQGFHEFFIGEIGFCHPTQFGEKLIESGWLENHQHLSGLPAGQHNRMRSAGGNVYRRTGRCCHPVSIDVEVHISVENIECFSMLPMKVETK